MRRHTRCKPKSFVLESIDPRRTQKNFLQDTDARLWKALAIENNPKEASKQALRDNKAEEREKHAPNRWAKLRACPDVQGTLRLLASRSLAQAF